MAIGKKPAARQPAPMWVTTADLPSVRGRVDLDVTEAPPNHSTVVTHAASDRCGNARGGVHVGAGALGRGGWVAVALGVLLVVVSTASGQGASGRRLALVVGNDAYRNLSDLENAVNDARAVALALRELGFTVTTDEDVPRSRLAELLGNFAGSLREDDVALFYFAGHGLQVDGLNYLIPTDYAGSTVAELRLSALSATEVHNLLSPARVTMLVLDACRNTPEAYRGFRSMGRGGLAPMEPRGSLIAYAAGAGQFAIDGEPGEVNGLFTAKFVEALREPGLEATDLFRRVRRQVDLASNGSQRPAVYEDLDYPFVFRTGAPSPPPASTRNTENLFWQSIQGSTDPADFEAYLELFANGTFSRLARNRLAALRGPGDVSLPSADPPRRRRPGDVFRDCAECPEMVVLPGGDLAMGRYEVTVGEYRAFVSATGGTGNDRWRDHRSYRQTDRHPVVNVSWDDARAYESWLSRTTGATYRLPTESEWERAASGSQPGCDRLGMGTMPDGTCRVGDHGANAAGLSDMVGNVWEWTSDCWEGDCGRRVVRGASWRNRARDLRLGERGAAASGNRADFVGFRVSRTLD